MDETIEYLEDIIKKPIENLETSVALEYQYCVASLCESLIRTSLDEMLVYTNRQNVQDDNSSSQLPNIIFQDNQQFSATQNDCRPTDDVHGLTPTKILWIINALKWIANVAKMLAQKIGQPLIPYIIEKKPYIMRSTYMFCPKYIHCKKFYNRYEHPTCKNHHYVHSLLKHDVESLIYFIKYIYDEKIRPEKNIINNIDLSLKTIIFVIKHMMREYQYVELLTHDAEKFHRHNPIDLYKRINVKKIYLGHMFSSRYNKNQLEILST